MSPSFQTGHWPAGVTHCFHCFWRFGGQPNAVLPPWPGRCFPRYPGALFAWMQERPSLEQKAWPSLAHSCLLGPAPALFVDACIVGSGRSAVLPIMCMLRGPCAVISPCLISRGVLLEAKSVCQAECCALTAHFEAVIHINCSTQRFKQFKQIAPSSGAICCLPRPPAEAG